MSYSVEYINCKICGRDNAKFLGVRGNLEYWGASTLGAEQEHMLTTTVQCKKCGFIYTNPRIICSGQKGSVFYNDPEKYRSSVSDDPESLFTEALDLIEKFAGRAGRLLDIGAGKGEFLVAARKRGWDVFGIEPSENFVNYANEKYGLNIENIYPQEARFSEGFFDVVTLNMALEHFDDPHGLLAIIRGMLKKNGLLYIEVPNMDSALLKIITLYYRFMGKEWSPFLSPLHPPYHCYGYRKSSLNFLCRSNNFLVKRFLVKGIGMRGFRLRDTGTGLKQHILSLSGRITGLLQQGDILIALAVKNAKE